MRTRSRRRVAKLAILGLTAGTLPVLLGATPSSAGTEITNNSCTNTVQAGTSAFQLTLSGTASPSPIQINETTTVSGTSFSIDVPPTTLLAGYALNLLTVGVNNIPAIVNITILGANTSEGTATFATFPGPDGLIFDNPLTPLPADESADNTFGANGPGISVFGTTTVTDPTPSNKTSGDESATPLSVTAPIPDSVWTGTGGQIALSLGDTTTTAALGGGALQVGFSCTPGDPGPVGCGPLPNPVACTTTIPVPADPFETVTVNAPPTAPVCTNENVSVGVTQSIPINLVDNCTDVNGNIDLSTFTVSTPGAGQGTITGSNGVYTYTAPAADPGTPVDLTFSVSDVAVPPGGALGSNTATLRITVLANQCTAPVTLDPDTVPGSGDETTGSCSLTEIVVQPVVGSTMTMDKVAGLVEMSPVVLDGEAQVSSGSLRDITVTNARGTSAGWSVSGFVTDLGAPGGPTVTLPTGQVVPTCSLVGGGGSPNRLCIPGDNMGWSPVASILHDVIFGDVAQVTAGPADAADAATWLSQLVAAGSTGVNGLGGLGEVNQLCSAPVDHSGGTFGCDASLFLGVPASAGAGIYTGGLVLTLL